MQFFVRIIIYNLLIGLLFSQTATLSPFSAFGVGDIYQAGQSRNMAMGYVGAALLHPLRMSKQNPASYSYLKVTTIDFSYVGKFQSLRSPEARNVLNSSGINDLTFAFPSPKKPFAFAFGAAPYSASGYEIQQTDTLIEDTITHIINKYRTGVGGLNKVFGAVAFRFLKNKLFVGAEFDYLFGNFKDEWRNSLDESTSIKYFAGIVKQNRMHGFTYSLGVIYKDTLKKDIFYSLGAKFQGGTSLKANILNYAYWQRDLTSFGNDTIYNNVETNTLPSAISFGLSVFNPKKWTLAADLEYQNWSLYKSYRGDKQGKLIRLKLGGEFIPDVNSPKYFKRIRLRAGTYASQEPMIIQDKQIVGFGLTGGIGFPMPRSLSMVSIGVDYFNRSYTGQNYIKEGTFTFFIGLSFNEVWFLKYKID